MRYRPRLASGELVPLPWPIAMYRALNHIAWPLEDNEPIANVYLERLLIFIGFLIFCEHNEVDMHYLLANRHDIDNMLTGIPTYLILVELQIRAFQLAWRKGQFKLLLQRFYADFYMPQDKHPMLFASIQRHMLATRLNSILYLMSLFNFFLVPIQNVIYHRREMLYKQIYPFDNTQLRYYIPLVCLNVWVGVIITSMLFGELNVLGELMMHMNARYIHLSDQLQLASQSLLSSADATQIAVRYRRVLVQVLHSNVKLNQFAAQIEEHFSFRIFIMFAFSTGLLCAMGFKAYTNPKGNIVYIVWFGAKFLELLAFGMLGSILYKTTDELSIMYYSCNWEQIVYHSSNAYENVRLMKMIGLAIAVNSRPFFLTGLKYFRVTLTAVVKIIQGAFSYFTFLTSFKD